MRGITDYTLAKRAVIDQFRRGGLSRLDICDAHPELMRAAKNIGGHLDRPCPVCSRPALRIVRYVYGDQLKQLSGRVVYPDTWVKELSDTVEEFRCYSIEVCVECAWNHLSACQLLGRAYAAKPAATEDGGIRPQPRAGNGKVRGTQQRSAIPRRVR